MAFDVLQENETSLPHHPFHSRVTCGDCRGTSEELENRLDAILDGQFEMANDGKKYDCIPKGADLETFLEDYYKDMEEAGKVEDD